MGFWVGVVSSAGLDNWKSPNLAMIGGFQVNGIAKFFTLREVQSDNPEIWQLEGFLPSREGKSSYFDRGGSDAISRKSNTTWKCCENQIRNTKMTISASPSDSWVRNETCSRYF